MIKLIVLSVLLNPEFSELQVQNPNGTEFVVEARKRGKRNKGDRRRGGGGLR